MSLRLRLDRLERAAAADPGPPAWDWNAQYRMQAGEPVSDEQRAFWMQFYPAVPAIDGPDPVEAEVAAPLRAAGLVP